MNKALKVNINIEVPNTIAERKIFLKKKLQKFRGKKYKCPALSNADVYVNANSIRETIEHASKSKKSSICALYMDKVIKEASLIKTSKPKSGTQTKKFKFIEMMIMEAEIEKLGKSKLTVGMKRSKDYIQYCITIIK
jgi:alpha-galactosidase